GVDAAGAGDVVGGASVGEVGAIVDRRVADRDPVGAAHPEGAVGEVDVVEGDVFGGLGVEDRDPIRLGCPGPAHAAQLHALGVFDLDRIEDRVAPGFDRQVGGVLDPHVAVFAG